MADYWGHWLEMGEKLGDKGAKDLQRKLVQTGRWGNFLWPGYGDNMESPWLDNRSVARARTDAKLKHQSGYVPTKTSINTEESEDEVTQRLWTNLHYVDGRKENMDLNGSAMNLKNNFGGS